jgi:tetratricopeptide (TPR) repeat protein
MSPASSRAVLESAVRTLESRGIGIPERLALAEACFRLAVLPDTAIEDGIELLRRAAGCDPYHPKLFFHLGRLLHKNGDPRGAVVEYCRALSMAPRSHRIYVHLALALKELGGAYQALGPKILESLLAGDDARLLSLARDLGDLMANQDDDPAKPKDSERSSKSAGQCRWPGIWKVIAMEEMTQPKPSLKAANRMLEEGKRQIQNGRGAAEYVLSMLFFVHDGPKACRQVAGWLRDAALAPYQETPAVRLMAATCELGEARNVGEFVSRAAGYLTDAVLPPELVASLHYCWYGAVSNIDAVKASELLDLYPEPFRSSVCFRELRLAILDHHARQAWTADRVDCAEILWQETIRLDPFRIPVAHNLALAAARTKSTDKYPTAWERAAELRYQVAAAAGDVRVELEDRVKLHRSIAQQSRLRHLAEGKKQPSDDELQKWLEDREALGIWLREGELAWLNSRLRFQSPLCMLGLPLDCSDEDAEAARKSLSGQFELCLRDRNWAGSAVFLKLVNDLADRALAQAKDPVCRKRDRYFDAEKAESITLELGVFDRGLLMFELIDVAADAEDLKPAGLDVARHLLGLPWKTLEPLAKKNGKPSADPDWVSVSISHIARLAPGGRDSKPDPVKAEAAIAGFEDCVRAVPDSVVLRLILCRICLDTNRNAQAYQAALEAIPIAEKMQDRREAEGLFSQLVICIDNAALAEIPDNVLSPTREKAGESIQYCRNVLDRYPRSAALRFLIATYLIQTAEDDAGGLKEAATLVEQGLDLLFTDKQIAEAHKLLEKAGSRSKSIDAFKEVRRLLESASTRARTAMSAVKEARTPARTPATLRQARAEIEEAIAEAGKAEEIAAAASLDDAVQNAREHVKQLCKLLEDLERV